MKIVYRKKMHGRMASAQIGISKQFINTKKNKSQNLRTALALM